MRALLSDGASSLVAATDPPNEVEGGGNSSAKQPRGHVSHLPAEPHSGGPRRGAAGRAP